MTELNINETIYMKKYKKYKTKYYLLSEKPSLIDDSLCNKLYDDLKKTDTSFTKNIDGNHMIYIMIKT